jgi:hypothetical protein
MAETRATDTEEPLERFKPTSGMFVGWLGVVLAVLVVIYVAVEARSLEGLRVALAALLAGVVVWMTQIRPRATAYRDHLVLHGSVRDVTVPYALIDDVVLGQTLNIWVGGKRLVCVGIGRSLGMDVRGKARSHGTGLFGTGRVAGMDLTPGGTPPPRAPAVAYHEFVVDRIRDLVAASSRRPRGEGSLAVRRRWAVPELATLGVLAVALLIALLV